ncbi:Molybdenum transport ATP-binding protein ModC [Leifsonia rubra CMS 76R]|nr:Molybdenum transport ATP-binding protein ModC [Leifsonia rubra CMS 76R]
MMVDVDLLVHRGPFTLDVSVSVAPGETLALLGPNGSGKSTMLAAIAGLLTPDRGTIVVGGKVLTQVADASDASDALGRNSQVPAHRRRIGLLGQDPLLFPHLSALENVAFGLRSQGITASLARARARQWIEDVGLASFADRRPAELSGGQQQRIAIARVLATEPDVLLFDEPMAALDVQNASLVRTLLRERLADRYAARHATVAGRGTGRSSVAPATIVVTHNVVDALVLADRVAILDQGRIIDIGVVARVLGQPANLFAATLVGLNLIEGIVETPELVRTPDGRQFSPENPLPPVGTEVSVVFPPSAVTVSSVRAATGATAPAMPNSWRATLELLEPGANGIRLTFCDDTVAAEAPPTELLAQGLSAGDAVTASIDPAAVTVYARRPAVPEVPKVPALPKVPAVPALPKGPGKVLP